jgi:hypothetical protein
LSNFLGRVAEFVIRRATLVVVIFSVLIITAIFGIPRIRFETNTVKSFKPDTEIRESTEFINDNFTGVTVMTLIVKTDEVGGIYEPTVIGAIDEFQKYVEKLRVNDGNVISPADSGYNRGKPIVGGSQSLANIVKEVNEAVHEDDPTYFAIPPEEIEFPVEWERYELKLEDKILIEKDYETGELLSKYTPEDYEWKNGKIYLPSYPGVISRIIDPDTGEATDIIDGRTAVANYVLLYSNATDPEELEKLVDNNVQTAAINFYIKSASSSVLWEVKEKAKEHIPRIFPSQAKADFTGQSVLTLTIQRLLVSTQIWSVVAALGIIFLLIAILSRSIMQGLFSIIPLTVALLINFGIIGWFRIPYEIATATITSIAIGIGIDYSIHFMERHKKSSSMYNQQRAVENTLKTTGKAIIFNAVAVAAGFLALIFSDVTGNVNMGILMALIMISSSVGAVTLLPSLLVLVKPKFLRTKQNIKDSS